MFPFSLFARGIDYLTFRIEPHRTIFTAWHARKTWHKTNYQMRQLNLQPTKAVNLSVREYSLFSLNGIYLFRKWYHHEEIKDHMTNDIPNSVSTNYTTEMDVTKVSRLTKMRSCQTHQSQDQVGSCCWTLLHKIRKNITNTVNIWTLILQHHNWTKTDWYMWHLKKKKKKKKMRPYQSH